MSLSLSLSLPVFPSLKQGIVKQIGRDETNIQQKHKETSVKKRDGREELNMQTLSQYSKGHVDDRDIYIYTHI